MKKIKCSYGKSNQLFDDWNLMRYTPAVKNQCTRIDFIYSVKITGIISGTLFQYQACLYSLDCIPPSMLNHDMAMKIKFHNLNFQNNVKNLKKIIAIKSLTFAVHSCLGRVNHYKNELGRVQSQTFKLQILDNRNILQRQIQI